MKAWRDGDCDSGGEEWAEEVELTKQAVEAVNQVRPRPRFMVLCGDLVHAMPGREWAHKGHAQHLKISTGLAASYPPNIVNSQMSAEWTRTPLSLF